MAEKQNNQKDTGGFEIGDVEGYQNEIPVFNHQQLVMKAHMKVIEAGSKELRQGMQEQHCDAQGNKFLHITEDTRKTFVDSVKSCMMTMACDLDEEADKNIREALEDLSKRKKELVLEEENEWTRMDSLTQRKWKEKNWHYIKGYLHNQKRFWQVYLDYEADIYREIFAELTKLTKRLNYYKSEDFEA